MPSSESAEVARTLEHNAFVVVVSAVEWRVDAKPRKPDRGVRRKLGCLRAEVEKGMIRLHGVYRVAFDEKDLNRGAVEVS